MIVDQAVGCHRFALVVRHPRLALGDHAGGEIQDHRRPARQRHAGSEGVGAEARVGATVGRDDGPRNHVDEVQRDQTFSRRQLGPRADAPQVVRIAQRHHAAAKLFGARDADGHRLRADHLAEAGVAVQAQHGASVHQRLDMGVGLQATFKISLRIARQHADAMRIMAREVGLDQVGGDGLHLLRAAAKTRHHLADG